MYVEYFPPSSVGMWLLHENSTPKPTRHAATMPNAVFPINDFSDAIKIFTRVAPDVLGISGKIVSDSVTGATLYEKSVRSVLVTYLTFLAFELATL